MSDSELVDTREQVAAVCRDLAGAGLVIGTAGNVSARCGQAVAISTTGLRLAEASADTISVVDLDGTRIAGQYAPTSELDLHLSVYRSTDAGAVVHAHSSGAVALSLVSDSLPPVHYQQLALGGAVPVVPYATFGSRELAAGTAEALGAHTAAILAHHGSVTRGADLAGAVEALELLEWLCQIYLTASAARGGRPPESLTDEQLADVVQAVVAKGYGVMRE